MCPLIVVWGFGLLPLEKMTVCRKRLASCGPFGREERRRLPGFWQRRADQRTSDQVEYRTPEVNKVKLESV